MGVLKTGDLKIPTTLLDPWVKTINEGSVIAALSDSMPMKFGKGEAFVFDIGEAEYVGEGGDKGASDVTKKSQNTEPFKFHKTVRWNEEVQWADEDHQLGVVKEILGLIQPALSRALDFGIIHGINPTGGADVAAMTQKLIATENKVEAEAGAKPWLNLDKADGLLLAKGFTPAGLAMDPTFAAPFATQRDDKGRKLYPDLPLSLDPAMFEGHRSATSRTVGAGGVKSDSDLQAIVGDFSAVRWGIQKSIGLEVIKYGDPDGQGDLKRKNQVAFRAEVVYGWGIADLGAFAKIVDAPGE
ncbi:phage major capsid protein [Arthrobacter rhombi]|uniref:phage major capsid protein n=1 Tax=Arthrobacter rhombi TaxID=71253 RepID=UPI003FD48391